MMAFPLGKAAILILLLLISLIESSSTENHINDDETHIVELRLIRQEIGLLREENQKQNIEILILKETVQLQNKSITKHEITMKEFDQEMKKSFNCYKNNTDSSEKNKRSKRPARLLPLQLLFDKDEDDDDHTTKKPPRKFYGPPTNCSDLSRLGYTLNGFYLVQHNYTKDVTNNNHNYSSRKTDTVYCAFKQEGTFNPSIVEHKLELKEPSPPLNKLVIEELDRIFSNDSHLGKWNLVHTTEKRRDEDILELKQEMFQLQHVVEELRSSELYSKNFEKAKLALSPSLNKKAIAEENQSLANSSRLGTSKPAYSTEKKGEKGTLELKQEKAQLQHVVKDFRSTELDIGTPYTSTVICFAVQKLSALSNSKQLGGPSVVRFEKEVLNLGESFKLNESVFIAPKEGIYEFTFNGYKKGNNKEHVLKVSLRLNGKEVVNSLAEELVGDHPSGSNPVHNFRCPISMHSLLKLNKGDRIDVISSQGTLHDHDSHYPIHFSGKLLFDEDAAKSRNQNSPIAVYFVLKKRASFNTYSKSVIPFELESLNVGGAFDIKKKAFTALVSGIYEFTLKGYKAAKNEVTYISIRLNGKAMANSWADKIDYHDHHTQFSLNSILKVKQGDIVDLFLKQGQIFDDDNQYTTFTGKLLLMDYQQLEKNIHNNIPIFNSLAVFFNVQKTTAFSKPYEVVPFEKQILNVGEAFDMNENAFTAPREGIYEFSFVGIKTIRFTELLSISLRLNGIPVTYASADSAKLHPFHTPISLHSIFKMKKGDRVDLFLETGGIYDDIDQYTHFTGKLLFAIENDKKQN